MFSLVVKRYHVQSTQLLPPLLLSMQHRTNISNFQLIKDTQNNNGETVPIEFERGYMKPNSVRSTCRGWIAIDWNLGERTIII